MRTMNPQVPNAYRVRITKKTVYKDGRETRISTKYIGPYSDLSTAKAQLTRARRNTNQYGTNYSESIVKGVVEVADINWREL